MAQRQHTCPTCSATIVVPDLHLHAKIACQECGTVVDKRSGLRWQAPPQQPAQPPIYPPPAYPPHAPQPAQNAPPGYPQPQYPFQYVPPAPRSRGGRGWIVALIVGGALLALVVLVVAVMAVVPLLVPAGGVGMNKSDEWILHRDEAGRFEILMPRRPRPIDEEFSTPVGPRRLYGVRCSAFRMQFEASYVDFSPWVTFDYHAAVEGIAEKVGGTVRHQGPYSVADQNGWRGQITLSHGKLTTVHLLFIQSRVYVISCSNHDAGEVTAKDSFLGSFRLISDEPQAERAEEPNTAKKQVPPQPELVISAREIGGHATVGENWSANMVVLNGEAPFEWSVIPLPPGIASIQNGDEFTLTGKPRRADRYSLVVTVRDRRGRAATLRHELVVGE